MILLQVCTENDFAIGMYWECFYYRIALKMFFFYRNILEMILLEDCTGNDFITEMNW